MSTATARGAEKVAVVPAHLYTPGGIFDHTGFHLPLAVWQPLAHRLLSPALVKLIKHLGPAHPDVQEAVHARLHGIWRIDRFDAPIEYYAAKALGVAQADIQDFAALPAAIREQADALLKRNHRPESSAFEETFENIFLIVGVQALWNQAVGSGTANSSSAAAGADAYYNNAQAMIGVGDSTTAAANTDTDLDATTNKTYVGMDASYPSITGGSSENIVFRATFGTSAANYGWNEFVVNNRNGSNSTTSGGSTLDRVVSSQGTKAVGQTWQPSLTLTIS